MPPTTRQVRSEPRSYSHWDRARLSVVMPIGAIVAVAIVCIVVAVLSSARHADEVAVWHEQHMLDSALANFGERLLHDVEGVARSDSAVRNIRDDFNAEWAQQHIGAWFENVLDHDAVVVFDADGAPLYSVGPSQATVGAVARRGATGTGGGACRAARRHPLHREYAAAGPHQW